MQVLWFPIMLHFAIDSSLHMYAKETRLNVRSLVQDDTFLMASNGRSVSYFP